MEDVDNIRYIVEDLHKELNISIGVLVESLRLLNLELSIDVMDKQIQITKKGIYVNGKYYPIWDVFSEFSLDDKINMVQKVYEVLSTGGR